MKTLFTHQSNYEYTVTIILRYTLSIIINKCCRFYVCYTKLNFRVVLRLVRASNDYYVQKKFGVIFCHPNKKNVQVIFLRFEKNEKNLFIS